jgi:heat shock protein HtpX
MSILFRALLALALMVGFYLLALGIVAGLGFLIYLDIQSGRVHVRLIVFAGIASLVILWAILPRFDRFNPPGPRLDRDRQPRLFKELEGIAAGTGQRMPDEVYVVADVNAFVAQRGGIMGLGSRRVMGLGLPLMQALTLHEFRAVLAHEFGHFHGGETKLGPWLYKTRAAIGRTVETLAEANSILKFPFLWYGKLFLLITHAVSRRQELDADRLAARLVGSEAARSGLQRVHAAALAFNAYMGGEVAPALASGFRPPLAEGFRMFLAEKSIAGQLWDEVKKELTSGAGGAYDTHPPLKERVAALALLPPGEIPHDDPPSISLFDDLDGAEGDLIAGLMDPAIAAALRPAAWKELPELCFIPRWREHMGTYGAGLAGRTATELPELVSSRVELGYQLAGKRLPKDEAEGLAMFTLGAALGTALLERGWRVETAPGAPINLVWAGHSLRHFDIPAELADGRLSADAWRARCEELGISDLRLSS